MDSAPRLLPYLIFGGFLSAALYCGIQLIRLDAQRMHRSAGPYLDLCVRMLIASIIGGRLAEMLTSGSFDIVRFFYFWQGGSFFLGGLPAGIGIGVISIYKERISIWETADIFAPALAAGYFFVRTGCFYSGFCRPFPMQASSLDALSGPLPVLDAAELFLAFGSLLVFFTLLKLRPHRQFQGQSFWTAVLFGGLLHATVRGLYDDLQSSVRVDGELVFALLAMVGAAGILTWLGSHKEGSATDPHQRRDDRDGNRL
jgi:phosphatidylglycerol:prolipoprotein diacylglycerol transferase